MQDTSPETVSFRLSPQQAQPLVLERGNAVQCAVQLEETLDAGRLRAALNEVAGRHEILRTVFVQRPGMRARQQLIVDELAPAWSEREAGELDDAGLRELLSGQAAQLDPERGPVLAGCLLSVPAGPPLLVLSACAAVADLPSLPLLVDECLAACRGRAPGEEPLQYADYAEWRHQVLTEAEPQEHDGRRFWAEQRTDGAVPLRVLFGIARASDAGALDDVPAGLGQLDRKALEATAQGAGATPAEVLEAAWHALIARMTGAEELVVAGQFDGRSQPDLQGAVGPYAQRAPIRTRAAEETTFAEVLDQVHRARVAAGRWQDHGGAEELAAVCERAAIGFSARQTPPAVRALSGARERLALSLELDVAADGISGRLRYDCESFDRADAEDLAHRYGLLLESVLGGSAAAVRELSITTAQERAELVRAATAGSAEAALGAPVHRLFELQAQRTPDRPAVVGAEITLTYAELDRRSNCLAHHLRALGADDRSPVGVCLERRPEMVVALLAILKAGSPYLPLNGEHPPARVAHQLAEAGARLAVGEAALGEALSEFSGRVVRLDADAERIAQAPDAAPEDDTGPDELAYVMYTSGSTGVPKGVKITHGNLANYARSIVSRIGIEEADAPHFGLVTAVSTDLGNTAIFPTLISGGCLHVLSAGAVTSATAMAAELRGQRLDALKITPTHLRALLGDRDTGQVLPRRWLFVGGEALSWELAEEVRARVPECRLVNHYGPTETTIGCCAHPVEATPRPDAATVPIGTPLAGVRAYVLDTTRSPVPTGVPGELCVAGAGVAAGYVGGQPEDAGRFEPDPFAGCAARMYRTGDRARRLRDGAIEFLGRLDDQVKIRGFRVEPGEIEAALIANPAVAQAAVVAQDDGHGGLELVAYLVAAPMPSVEELRSWVGRTLPEYMIPALFAGIPALPLTASGKVDRRALAAMADVVAQREQGYVAPRDEIEAEIAAIWQELLGVERVGVLDDFFALGGHSLLATQAIMRIRRAHGDVPLRALLAAPTVATLAEVVRANSAGAR